MAVVIPAALTVVEEAGGAPIALVPLGIAAAGLGAFALAASSQLAQVKAAVENSFQAWQSSLQRYVTPVLQEIPAMVSTALNDITPLVKGASTGISEAFASIQSALQSSGLQQFVSWMGSQVPSAMSSLTTGVEGFASGLATMAESSTVFIRMVESGFDSLAQDFEKFASSNGFKQFISYLEQGAPVVSQFLEQAGTAAAKLVVALEPLGDFVLHAFTTALTAAQPFLSVLDKLTQSATGSNPIFQILDSAAEGFGEVMNKVASEVSHLWNDVPAPIRAAASAISDIGSGIAHVLGITSSATTSTQHFSNAATQLAVAFQQSNSNSPTFRPPTAASPLRPSWSSAMKDVGASSKQVAAAMGTSASRSPRRSAKTSPSARPTSKASSNSPSPRPESREQCAKGNRRGLQPVADCRTGCGGNPPASPPSYGTTAGVRATTNFQGQYLAGLQKVVTLPAQVMPQAMRYLRRTGSQVAWRPPRRSQRDWALVCRRSSPT